jgi:hypothetical protein
MVVGDYGQPHAAAWHGVTTYNPDGLCTISIASVVRLLGNLTERLWVMRFCPISVPLWAMPLLIYLFRFLSAGFYCLENCVALR